VATEEKRIVSGQTGPEADKFAVDFRDGVTLAEEWIEGKSDLLDDLVAIVRAMPSEWSGREAGFIACVGAAARGARQGAVAAPDLAKAKLLLTPPAATSPEAVSPQIDLEGFHRRRRERERAARLKELARANAAIPIGHVPTDRSSQWW
jgi:hypothetical protein